MKYQVRWNLTFTVIADAALVQQSNIRRIVFRDRRRQEEDFVIYHLFQTERTKLEKRRAKLTFRNPIQSCPILIIRTSFQLSSSCFMFFLGMKPVFCGFNLF